MSLILTGLIQFFRPLLASLSGVLECKGVAPWYFLTGLRIVAIFFSSGPWDALKQDVSCSWVSPTQDKSKEFCTVLCQNQYFPLAVSSTAALSFMVVLLLVGLMRLTVPRKKKKKEEKDENDKLTGSTEAGTNRGIAVVAAGPGGASSVYLGPRGLPVNYDRSHSRLHHHRYYPYRDWPDWHGWHGWGGMPMAHMPGGYIPHAGLQPYGGYGMPFHPGYADTSEMPEHSYGMPRPTMPAYPADMPHPTMATLDPGTDQYEMRPLPGSKESISAPSSFNGTPPNDGPVKYASVPMVYKNNGPSRHWSEDKDREGLQQRYRGPKEYGDGNDYAYTMGRRCAGRGKMNPRYSEESKHTMATKCKAFSDSNVDQIAAHPRPDAMNMAIKRRPVPGGKMKTKQQLAFGAPGRSDMSFGNMMPPPPWMAEGSHCRSTDENKAMTGAGMAPGPTPPCPGGAASTCTGNNPCPPSPSSQPQRGPGSSASPTSNPRSVPGPQDHYKLILATVCGVPLFDIWVALLLASEICFLCTILLIQMPRVVGRSWICSPDAIGCPEAVECAVKGKADKRMALWGLAFTAILFIIACCGYFNIRFCCNKRCGRMCSEPQGACAADTAPEGRVISGDTENDTEEKEEGL